MFLNIGTIAAAENRRIMIPLFITNKFFNKVLPSLLLIGNIILGFIIFKWYLAILYATIGVFLFFFIDYWITQLYLKKRYGENDADANGFYYNDYRVKLNFKITLIGYLALIIYSLIAL
ncbi:MAG: hypothetical protein LC122_09645 [Chitinophagales bacterium]|nr:hypothetical protein [Chitinophagales bacterium]